MNWYGTARGLLLITGVQLSIWSYHHDNHLLGIAGMVLLFWFAETRSP